MPSDAQRLTHLPDGRIQIRAHAKLNLGLRIFPAQPDGFHDLESWMVPISWHDTLTVDTNHRQDADATPLTLRITGRSEGIPAELDKNLVGRAAVKLAAAANIPPTGTITLHKVLPPGGGIGGGSSDAASALVALNHAWDLHWDIPRLEQIASALGSDIPFFIRGKASLCIGRGEIMTPMASRHPLFAVLLIPRGGCPTKEVYQAFDAGHQHKPPHPKTDWPACAHATAAELSAMLVNDLEPGAFHVAPWLAELRDRAQKVLRQKVHLTGSGSTLFALCDSGAATTDMLEKLSNNADWACVPVEVLR